MKHFTGFYMMASLVFNELKSNFSGFNIKIKQQVSGAAIGTNSVPRYECLLIENVEASILKTQ